MAKVVYKTVVLIPNKPDKKILGITRKIVSKSTKDQKSFMPQNDKDDVNHSWNYN